MRKVVIAAVASLVVAVAMAVPASAGYSMDLVLTIDPVTGEAGTEVTFTPVDPCPVAYGYLGAANAPGDTYAALSLVADPTDPSDFIADTLTDGSGDWSLTYTVPASEPIGDLTFYGFCLYETWPPTLVDSAAVPDNSYITAEYAPVVFTVTTPPSTTTTTTTSTTTSTTTPPAAAITASPTTVFPGDSVTVTASGFKPGSNVVITLESDPVNLGSYVADSAGRIATTIVVPADFPAGPHTIKLTGTDIAGQILVLSTGITVASRIQAPTTTVATAAPATTSTLPRTGSSITEPALIAAGALLVGGSLAVVAARRRRASER